jgi:hypothetical protein
MTRFLRLRLYLVDWQAWASEWAYIVAGSMDGTGFVGIPHLPRWGFYHRPGMCEYIRSDTRLRND